MDQELENANPDPGDVVQQFLFLKNKFNFIGMCRVILVRVGPSEVWERLKL